MHCNITGSCKKGRQEEDIKTQKLQSKLNSILAHTIPFVTLSKESKTLFPDLEKVTLAKAQSCE